MAQPEWSLFVTQISAAQLGDERKPATDPPVPLQHDQQTYTLDEWRKLRRISASTERRMREKGLGPNLVRLSATRWGVTVKADREWLAKGGAASIEGA